MDSKTVQQLSASGRHQDCLQACQQLLKREPENPLPWKYAGKSLLALGQYQKSQQCLTKAHRLDKNDPEIVKDIGNIFNAPISAGTSSEDFLRIFNERILVNVDLFKPEVIIISAGFDAHQRDPLAAINLNSDDYFTMTHDIVEIANRHSKGRVISFLEGGYDLLALAESIQSHFKGLST